MDVLDGKMIESGTAIRLETAVAGTETGSQIDAIEIGSRSENAAKTEIESENESENVIAEGIAEGIAVVIARESASAAATVLNLPMPTTVPRNLKRVA